MKALLPLLASCSLDSKFAPATAGDASPDMPVEPDATVPLGLWSAPVKITELSGSTTNDSMPALTDDRLEIFFASDRPGGKGGSDIWTAHRASPEDSWRTPAPVAELSSSEGDIDPSLSRDGLTMWFASDRGGNPHDDLFVATRASLTSSWSAPVKVTELVTSDDDRCLAVSEDKLHGVYFSLHPTGHGSNDLYAVSRASVTAPWAAIRDVTELNGGGSDAFPTLSPDGLTMIFEQLTDLYVATRPSIDAAFEAPTAIQELNSPGEDFRAWISPDLRHIVFASDRDGTVDLFEASR